MESEPVISQDLVRYLDQIFPEVEAPSRPEDDRVLWKKLGERGVVLYLRRKAADQEEARRVLQ